MGQAGQEAWLPGGPRQNLHGYQHRHAHIYYLGAPRKVHLMAFGWNIYKALRVHMHELNRVDHIFPLDALVKEYLEILEAFLGENPNFPTDSECCSHRSTGVEGD